VRSIRGIFQNGVAQPDEPVEGQDGQPVIITFLNRGESQPPSDDSAWDELAQLLKNCAVETGITDLADQH
jgi:hypothetical protein